MIRPEEFHALYRMANAADELDVAKEIQKRPRGCCLPKSMPMSSYAAGFFARTTDAFRHEVAKVLHTLLSA